MKRKSEGIKINTVTKIKAVALVEIECNSFLFFITNYNIPRKTTKEYLLACLYKNFYFPVFLTRILCQM